MSLFKVLFPKYRRVSFWSMLVPKRREEATLHSRSATARRCRRARGMKGLVPGLDAPLLGSRRV